MKDTSGIFRVLRRFLIRLTPYNAIMSQRNMDYARFTIENVTLYNLQRHLNILDVGGKFGYQAHLLVKMFQNRGYNSLAIVLDIDPNAVAKGKRLHSELHYVLGDSHYLPFRSDIFQIVYSHSLLEHLESPKLAIAEQVRVCKGIINVQIPNLQYFIEPHTKAPLLFYYPKRVREKVVEITKPTATQLNFSVILENLIKWFYDAGAKLLKSSKIYHAKWTRILLKPQGFLLSFKKTAETHAKARNQ